MSKSSIPKKLFVPAAIYALAVPFAVASNSTGLIESIGAACIAIATLLGSKYARNFFVFTTGAGLLLALPFIGWVIMSDLPQPMQTHAIVRACVSVPVNLGILWVLMQPEVIAYCEAPFSPYIPRWQRKLASD